jgi:mycothiol synthase
MASIRGLLNFQDFSRMLAVMTTSSNVLKTDALSKTEPNIRMRRPHLTNLPVVPALPNGYDLGPFTQQDNVSALAALLTTAFNDPWDEPRTKTELSEAPDVHAVYIVTYRNDIVATASSQLRKKHTTTSGYVHWVGTHPDHRGKGLAYALVARVLQDFVARGYVGAYLETQQFRIPAIKTYLKLGFTPEYEVEGENHQAIWSSTFQNLLAKKP